MTTILPDDDGRQLPAAGVVHAPARRSRRARGLQGGAAHAEAFHDATRTVIHDQEVAPASTS
ncbi:MAG: hypothetical protein HS111_18080 [Kofleriaceae bacterium]|nr:hypothetical protein [Kofleriaceae bacterium]